MNDNWSPLGDALSPQRRCAVLRTEPLRVSSLRAAAAIAGVCDDLLARQAERNIAILEGRAEANNLRPVNNGK